MIKVEHTKTHFLGRTGTGYGRLPEVLVTDAKLVLVECTSIDGLFNKYLGDPLVLHDKKYGAGRKYYKPILISETEKIEVGDLSACYDCTTNEFVGIGTVEEIYENNIAWCSDHKERLNYQFICRKILSLPEHFSPQQLQAIVEGNWKEGKCLVECEKTACCHNYVPNEYMKGQFICCGNKLPEIKLNPHITIYPLEEKMYTREEVKQLFISLLETKKDIIVKHQLGLKINDHAFNGWFEQNVK